MNKFMFLSFLMIFFGGMSIIKSSIFALENKHNYIFGNVSPGFEEVKIEFEKNFIERGEIGAACAVYYKGIKVVDLWGGYRKDKDLWKEETKAITFSATKGISAIIFAKLNSEGLIDYEEKVAKYWPEFAKNGKEDITIRQLLAHQGGLVLLENKLQISQRNDYEKTARELENAKPLWKPGEYQGYHAGTIGLYMQELVRRVDKKHRTLGTYFREEIAEPLGIEFYIGLPEYIKDEEIAEIKMVNPFLALLNIGKMPKGMRKVVMNFNSLFMKSMVLTEGYDPNKRETWRIEEPAGNGIGTARAMAKLYGIMAMGGEELGIKEDTMDFITGEPEKPEKGYIDRVMNIETRYKAGFMKPDPIFTFSNSDKAFGFLGVTGTFAFADPDRQIGYAYVTRKMGYYGVNDPREKNIRAAMYRCIEQLEKNESPN
ncbi:MAG: beta-lactamase family protein [Firmicutes bacterium]|nr:beta-lactamase family protein [Bacillota bacterium]